MESKTKKWITAATLVVILGFGLIYTGCGSEKGPSAPVNHAPVLNAIDNKSVNEGATLSFTISATDPDNDTLTYSASNLPKDATFNPSTRTFEWITKVDDVGIYNNVVFRVTDPGGLYDEKSITITVNDITPSAAVVNTGIAINITPTSATLNGEVNPQGLTTTTHFEYGVDNNYGSSTNDDPVGSGNTDVNVTANLTSLQPFTTYHYRLTATNSAGTTNGADMTFNTPISTPSTSQSAISEGYTPDIAASSDGTNVYIVYQGDIGINGGNGIIFRKSTDSGETFSSPVNISPGSDGDLGSKPAIAVDSNGDIHVVYQRDDYYIYYAKSTDGGNTFSTPTQISDAEANHITRGPQIAIDNNYVYVVWDGNDDKIYLDKSQLDLVNFGKDNLVSSSTGHYNQPDIAIEGGNIYVAYAAFGTSKDILLTKSSDGGANFSNPVVVDHADYYVLSNPRLAVSGNNVYVIRDDTQNVYSDIRLRVSTDGGATFSDSSITVNDNTGNNDKYAGDIKIDAKGTLYFIWRDGRNDNNTPDIYYAYASTSNDQLVIAANVKINSSPGKPNYGHKRPALAVGNNKVYTVWQGYNTNDSSWTIYFSR